ncbi:phosphoribosyltransferase family protein [Exiguobacterium aestuarii]|uniref:Phosphoribosyltransferase family protein n=1 Tax=Exiguobacterium aestuarii TaxID=273527 RepID=A0ABW2PIF5_9BACL|nr:MULTISPECIES: phosphoribosyltransferase family protein [Exiguobacterium]MCT4785136.1 phosphoribosyltransferase [Exiguobacterium aestuarii]
MISKQIFKKCNDVHYLNYYHPYRIQGDRNPNFNDFSGRILNLKDNKDKDIQHFFLEMNTGLNSRNVVICVVPSSDSSKVDSGIKKLAQKFANFGERIDGTSCLRRHTSVLKAAHGGSRDVETHLRSIEVTNNVIIRDREVILLDDVCTSGSSLTACEILLKNAGASNVHKVVIGLTFR